DPFTGARFVLGAVVDDGGADVRVARPERLPGARCLGDRDLAVAVRRLSARLSDVASSEALPHVFGPYTTLAERQEVPQGVGDPVAWVEGLLSPERPTPGAVRAPRGRQRGTVGYRFFETWNVARHMHKTFRPESDWGGWLSRHAAGLQQVTHWVH